MRAVDEAETQGGVEGKEVFIPALNFLWEVYKIILDIVRSNQLMLIVYNETAKKAFEFCLRYNRKKDFSKITDILYNHLNSIIENATDYEEKLMKIPNLVVLTS